MENLWRVLGVVLVVTLLSTVKSLPVDNLSEITISPLDTYLVQRGVGNHYIIRETISKSSPIQLPQLPAPLNGRVRSENDVFLGEMVPGSALALE